MDSWILTALTTSSPLPSLQRHFTVIPWDRWEKGTLMEKCCFAEVESKEDVLPDYKHFVFVS